MAVSENLLNPVIKKRLEVFMYKRSVKDTTITIKPATIENPNMLGLIWELRITGKNAGNSGIVEFDWILKSATLNEVVRKYVQIDRLFKKEIYVYDKILPAYQDLVQQHNVQEIFAVTPEMHLYFTDTFQESLILENLKKPNYGFVSIKSSEPCSHSHVTLAMKALGKLHALSYALHEHNPEEFKKFSEFARNRFNVNVNIELYSKHQKLCCEKVLEALNSGKDKSMVPFFKKFMEKPFEYQMQAIKMGAMGPYAVLTHGDAILDNMLFKYDDLNHPDMPTDICLLDWQFCRLGSPALDVSQFLFTATDKEFRDKYYSEMVRTYYYSLCSYLAELKCDAEKILPFDILQLQLKRYAVYGLSMAVMTLHIIMNDAPNNHNWKENIKASDIEATFSETITKNVESYRTRIRDIVLDFKDYGYFEFLN